MRWLIVVSTLLSSAMALADNERVYCSNYSGTVQVELIGSGWVRLYGQNAELVGYTQLESEITHLNDRCFQYTVGDASPVLKVEETEQWTVAYYTVEFEMQQICRRASTPAYRFNMDPRTSTIRELLLCQDFRGVVANRQ